ADQAGQCVVAGVRDGDPAPDPGGPESLAAHDLGDDLVHLVGPEVPGRLEGADQLPDRPFLGRRVKRRDQRLTHQEVFHGLTSPQSSLLFVIGDSWAHSRLTYLKQLTPP